MCKKVPDPIQTKQLPEQQLKELVIDALKGVFDPEIPVDVYELGLIYEISVYPVNNVHVTMTLTSPNCPVAESLPQDVHDAVAAVPSIQEVQITLTFEPPYTQDMMSEEARLVLGLL